MSTNVSLFTLSRERASKKGLAKNNFYVIIICLYHAKSYVMLPMSFVRIKILNNFYNILNCKCNGRELFVSNIPDFGSK